jgi:hypothetical protein
MSLKLCVHSLLLHLSYLRHILHEVTSETLLEELSNKSILRSVLPKLLEEKTNLYRTGSIKGIR